MYIYIYLYEYVYIYIEYIYTHTHGLSYEKHFLTGHCLFVQPIFTLFHPAAKGTAKQVGSSHVVLSEGDGRTIQLENRITNEHDGKPPLGWTLYGIAHF